MEASFPECVFVLSLKPPHPRRRRLFFVRPIPHDSLTKPTNAQTPPVSPEFSSSGGIAPPCIAIQRSSAVWIKRPWLLPRHNALVESGKDLIGKLLAKFLLSWHVVAPLWCCIERRLCRCQLISEAHKLIPPRTETNAGWPYQRQIGGGQ